MRDFSFFQTSFGKLSSAICYDHDFPQLIHQAGKNGADILLSPSLDWKEITPFHAYISVFRVVENGVSIFRPAGNGLSIAADFYGNILAQKNDFTSDERIMFADIPTKGTRTIYSYIGDLFAWLCFIGFVSIFIYIFIKKKKVNRN